MAGNRKQIRRLALAWMALFVAACAPKADDAYVEAFRRATFDDGAFERVLGDRAAAVSVSAAAVVYLVDGAMARETYIGDGVDADSVFQAASMSKAVAAAGILSFAKSRGVSPDEDIRPYIDALEWSDIPGGDKPVTLRGLLSHTEGANVSGFLGYRRQAPLPSNLQIVQGVRPANSKAIHLDGEKGVFAYSGGGYQIAQLFAETVSGEPFPLLMKRLVLDPLGMTRSFFDANLDENGIAPLRVAPADAGLFPIEGPPVTIRGSWRNYPEAAAAGLWTTPGDYAKFARALMQAANGEPPEGLDREVASLMLSEVDAGYGLGVALQNWSDPADRRFGHGGSNRGYKCRFSVAPAKKAIVVVMTNAPGGSALSAELIDGLMAR